jgi:hypothetical protein
VSGQVPTHLADATAHRRRRRCQPAAARAAAAASPSAPLQRYEELDGAGQRKAALRMAFDRRHTFPIGGREKPTTADLLFSLPERVTGFEPVYTALQAAA